MCLAGFMPIAIRNHWSGCTAVRVYRQVHDRHPSTHLELRQSLEALVPSAVSGSPNLFFCDPVYRREDERGRVSYASCQEGWLDAYQRFVARSARQLPEART